MTKRRHVVRRSHDAGVELNRAVNPLNARRYRLTNPEGYSLTYHGLVIAARKRLSHGVQALGSYTFSRAYGLQPSSGTTALERRSPRSAPHPSRSPPRSRSGAIRTIVPMQAVASPTIVRTCSGS